MDIREYVPFLKEMQDEDLKEWFDMMNQFINEHLETEYNQDEEIQTKVLTDLGLDCFPFWTNYRFSVPKNKE